MTASERIRLLRRHGLENAVIAAILGVETADVAAHVADPSVDVALGGGGSVDVTGLLPLDGSRAMTGPLEWAEGPSLRQLGSALALGGDGGSELYLVPNESGAVSWGGSYLDTWVGDTYANLELHTATGNITMYAADERVQFGADMSLRRNQWGGALLLTPDGLAIAATDPDPDYVTAAIYLDHAGKITAQPAQPDDTAFLIGPAAVGDGVYRFQMDGHGQMWWSDGAAPEDTSLRRTAPGTLEIDHTLSFKGAVGDVNAGATLEWSDYWYGLVMKGRPGSGDAELYLLNPDDDSNYSNLWPGGSSLQGSDGSYANYGSGGASIAGPYGGTTIGQGGVSLSAHTNGGVNLNAGGCDFLANPDDFAEDALLKRRYFSFGYYNESGSHFNISPDGELAWGDGSSFVNLDTSLQRVAAGVLEIPQHGGGFKLWNDDGSVSKTVRLNHAGTALELV